MSPQRFLIHKSGVRQSQLSAVPVRRKLDRYHGLGAFGGGSQPGKFHQSVSLESQKAAVVRMAPATIMRFEIKGGVDLAFPGAANQRSICSVQAR